MKRTESPIEIAGAGPAGLAAAITMARNGLRVSVHERNPRAGQRFHGDFQGLENWSTEEDVLDELAGLGIAADFPCTPFREAILFDPEGKEHPVRSEQPLFYLLRRGTDADTLDTALLRQARDAGVDIHFQSHHQHMPNGGIAATGPHQPDAIAVGYTFSTDMADGVFTLLGNRYAPAGYSYLLICKGHGTLASCMFRDFHNETEHLEHTLEFFTERLALRMREPRRFGGSGNFFLSHTARRGGMLYVGEAAGFQDPFAGFGMRYAMLSGHLAGKAFVTGRLTDYDPSWHKRLRGQMRAGFVNRYLFETFGDAASRHLARRSSTCGDVRAWLRRRYQATWLSALLLPLARYSRKQHRGRLCVDESCDCTWCRCSRHGADNG